MAQRASVFCQVHSNTAFGWRIARAFACARKPFPVAMIGRNHWVFRAYMMCLAPAYRDHDVETALLLSQQPATSAMLKAMLIAGLGERVSDHLDVVAQKTGIPRLTVEAYEVLLFNVLDRHQDGLYLSDVVYPNGRQVELEEDYFKNTPPADLILRAGYNYRDVDIVAHLCGVGDSSDAAELGARSDREAELERGIMGNALFMAKLGMLNQRNVGMQRALTLLAAKSSSRRNAMSDEIQASSESPEFAEGMAAELAAAIAAFPPLTEADRRDLQVVFRPGLKVYSDDEGNVSKYYHSSDCSQVATPVDPVEPAVSLMEWLPEPITAVWRNKDFDKPIVVVARMHAPGLPDHYLTDENSGVPASEVFVGSQTANAGRPPS